LITAGVFVVFVIRIVGIFSISTVALADAPTKTDGFVCPVLGGKAGIHGQQKGITLIPNAEPFYTVVGPEVSVPIYATNGNNDTNSPGGNYVSPGEDDYTAIWP
jgi:hypothetical protein